jgi:threonine dehydratase
MRILFTDTHNVAEGAGAAALAGALQERDRSAGKRIAVVQTGGNVDRALFAEILAEGDTRQSGAGPDLSAQRVSC